MKKTSKVCAAALLAGGSIFATASTASAASVDCSDPTVVPNPVYIAGSSASQPILQALAVAIGPSVSIIYAKPTSCVGLQDVTATPPVPETTPAFLLSSTAGVGAETCTASGGLAYPTMYSIDIGVSDVFPSTCIVPPITLQSTQKEFRGAIQAMEIVVPYTSSQNSISADAAYVVFGFATQTYTVAPWSDPTAIWTRDDTSGTQLMVGTAIGLSGDKWLHGLSPEAGAPQIRPSGGALATDIEVGNVSKPNSTIGILSAGTADPSRSAPVTADGGGVTSGGIKPLAFQDTNQTPAQECGYYPDSDLSHFDKINVRQGRYDIWGPLHFVTNVDSSGNPIASPQASGNLVPSTSAAVAKLINVITHQGLTSSSTPALQSVIAAEASAFFVPDCAMQVLRLGENGAEASYQPAQGCGCYFESLTGGGTTLSSYCTQCTTASVATDCPKDFPVCNFGYCEAQ